MRVTISSVLPVAIETAWERLQETKTLRFVASGVMTYDAVDLPPNWQIGETINLKPCLFGTPQGDHFVTVTKLNETEYEIVTEEHGGHISSWRHRMHLEETYPTECRLTDTIDIKAGWRTPLVWLFAQYFYRHRHRRWQQLVSST